MIITELQQLYATHPNVEGMCRIGRKGNCCQPTEFRTILQWSGMYLCTGTGWTATLLEGWADGLFLAVHLVLVVRQCAEHIAARAYSVSYTHLRH